MRDDDERTEITSLLRDAARRDDPIGDQRLFAELHAALFDRALPPVSLARYRILDRIGSGGLGIVYRAHDPELERDVAIKFLRDRDDGDDQRLLNEARAIARLAHPNIVAIHDVGAYSAADLPRIDHDEVPRRGLFLVMELVRGVPLHRFVAEQHPNTRRILEAFVQAGQALAHAHRHGIVHGDFKPANVLVDEAGRVRVLDFGLSRIDDLATGASPGSSDPEVTTIAGTPPYMAPEQHAGRKIDARSDQFSFCVALFEALHGERPFDGRTLDAMVWAKREGLMARPRMPRRVPPRIARAIARGLAPSPNDRHPSMEALLHQLGPRPRPRWPVFVGSALAGAGAWAAVRAGHPEPAESIDALDCATSSQALVEAVWNERVAEEIARRFEATAVSYAARSRELAERGVQRYVEAWVDARDQVCSSGSTGSDAALQCLERRRASLVATLGVLAETSREDLSMANDAVELLPRISDCHPDAEPRATATAASGSSDAELERARALLRAGRHHAALHVVELGLAGDVEPSTLGAWRYLEGMLNWKLDRLPRAEAALRRAAIEAERWPDEGLSIEVAAALAGVQTSAGRYDEAEDTIDLARAKLARHGIDGDPRALVEFRRGVLASHTGRAELAIASLRHAERIWSELEGEDGVHRAMVIGTLGPTLAGLGRIDEAIATTSDVLERQRARLGSDHPIVGEFHANLGAVLQWSGRPADALPHFDHAIRIAAGEREDHHHVSITLNNAAHAAVMLGRPGQAIEYAERSLEILSALGGDDHPEAMTPRNALAYAYLDRGRSRDAIREAEAALAIARRVHGAEAIPTALIMHTASLCYERAGELDRAVDLLTESLRVVEQQQPDFPGVVQGRADLARQLARRGETGRARRQAERVRPSPSSTDTHGLEARLALAQTSVLLGDPESAIETLRALVPAIDDRQQVRLRTLAELELARASLLGGDRRVAHEIARRARDRVDALDCGAVQAELALLLAELAPADDPQQARMLGQQALAIVRAAGADPSLVRPIEQWLEQRGIELTASVRAACESSEPSVRSP